ncbi:hypothetical protein [Mycobacteroides abscessus]|uniref:hypothetical protein n=1 Tax=Mycobacteroides abscessus TaxID=36809 RepID=UPI000929B418|nr:hypothetical protein [Mycobacteroides abscessus]SHT86321.1 Conserved alanine-rich protein of uncharacterised function [Mycobacteroides abscessus subsp. bolletii]SHX41318.1 Conserved alanine-rich protein of uncharacterised function [Mycobacteroides abscessus subsp. bolletii]SHX46595.1 Conserved alanine-rich protein of uncharacterised function [Mycobacteroides abscessus subsp. bolletii]SHX92744.1 Conserved alanine-rich protein of uncharacterised function [Mycobacteroides abscessus subsp. bolle
MVSNPPGGADDEGNLDKVNLAEVPLSLEVLADLHAGVYDTGDSDVLRQRADQDPDARQTLAALDQVRAELVAWMDSPAPEVPESVVDDIVAALRAESAKSTLPAIAADAVRPADVSLNLVTGPVPLDHRRHPAAKRRWLAYSGAGLAAAACAAVAITVVAQDNQRASQTTTAVAGPSLSQQIAPKTAAPVAPELPARGAVGQTAFPLSGNEITALVGRAPAFGELDDAARRASCLTGLGLSASTPVLGAQTLDIDGSAVLMVLPAERPGELLAVAVRPGCSQTDPQRVAQTRIGATPSR